MLSLAQLPGRNDPTGDQASAIERLRLGMTQFILAYYWFGASLVVIAAHMLGASVVATAAPLALIGVIASIVAMRRPTCLSTRLTLTVAINAQWMFALYPASMVQQGAFMLEVHMLYFIATAIVTAYACWRSVVLTTVAALTHHLILSLVAPAFVWPGAENAWIHFTNHSLLGAINCAGGVLIACAIEKMVRDLEGFAKTSEQSSMNDELTRLLNRRGLKRLFQQRCKAGAEKDYSCALLNIDLDGFKSINDWLGHAGGDKLLVEVARKLEEIAPDRALVARMGGDEFVVVLIDDDGRQIDRLSKAFLDWTREPIEISGRSVRFGASIGSTSSRESGLTLDQMLLDADTALYVAKGTGKNRTHPFTESLRAEAAEKRQLADDLIRAIAADEFEPYFQTQHCARDGSVVGVEALARWRHPTRGVLTPNVFLPVAHAVGRMREIDQRIMQKSVEVMRRLESRSLGLPKLSVNVSFARLRDPDLLASVDALEPMEARLTFEVLETVFVDDQAEVDTWRLDLLRERGIGIEIDDFGTGHASIIGLTRLRPNALKIDRQLVAPLPQVSRREVELVNAIVEMAQALEIKTVAEGVETVEHVEVLNRIGVDVFQGFLFSRPMTGGELHRRLEIGMDVGRVGLGDPSSGDASRASGA